MALPVVLAVSQSSDNKGDRMNAASEPEVMEVQTGLALVSDSEVDTQVTTARRYPRSITKFLQRAQEMATLTPEIAAACIYALPRDGKTVEGPSARFAEVMASAWTNIRAEGKTLGDDGQYVTSRGTAWDVENNVAIAFEVKRRITGRNGQTYNADMITVTGNAGASIALRNAILKVIPTPFWKPIYNACRKVIAGDAKTFAARRDDMLKAFNVMGVTDERLCNAFGLKGKADITLEHMVTMTGFYTALRDGDTTIEEAFPDGGGHAATPQPAQRKSQQNETGHVVPPATTAAAAAAPVVKEGVYQTDPAPHIGVIQSIADRGGAWLIRLDTGFQCSTRDSAVALAAGRLQAEKTRVEMITRAASDPKFVRVIEEIQVVT